MMPSHDASHRIIRYDFTLDDMLAANELYAKHNSKSKRTLLRLRVVASLLTAILLFAFAEIAHRESPSAIAAWFPFACGIGSGLFVYGIAFPACNLLMRFFLRTMTRMAFSRPNMSTYFGESSLEVDEDGFTHRSNQVEARYAWNALQRVETIQDQTVLYVGSLKVINIPHRRIIEGDLADVLDAMNAHCRAS